MTEETQALVAELRKIAAANVCDLPNMGDEAHEPPEITWGELDAIGRTADGAAAALTSLSRDLETARQERDAALKDAAFHADCRPNRRQAEAAYADNKALNDKVADLIAAVRAARAETETTIKERDEARGMAADLVFERRSRVLEFMPCQLACTGRGARHQGG